MAGVVEPPVPLNEADTATFSQVLTALQRDINCLSDDNKSTRKRAATKIGREIERYAGDSSSSGEPASTEPATKSYTLQDALCISLLKPLLKLYADDMEKCRELSVELVSRLLQLSGVGIAERILPYVVPALASRLDHTEIVEKTEEVRQLLADQVNLIISKFHAGQLAVYIDQMVKILVRTVADPFHDVKKTACQAVVKLASSYSEQFHMASGLLVPPITVAITHQHSKVRTYAVKAAGAVICHGHQEALEELRAALAARTMDQSPSVRKAVFEMAHTLMTEYRDRYSYWHKLLPLLVVGLADESPQLMELSKQLFDQFGAQYEKENKESLQDRLHFATSMDQSSDETSPQFQPVSELGVGCCEIVRQNVSKILPSLSRDLTDWTAGNRRQAARLLKGLLPYERDNATMHMEKLLDTLCIGVRDEDQDVQTLAFQCCQLLGLYIKTNVWVDTMTPHLRQAGIQPHIRAAQLMVTRALTEGSTSAAVGEKLQDIVAVLSQPENSQSRDKLVQHQLIKSVQQLIGKAGPACSTCEAQLFSVLLDLLPIYQGPVADIDETLNGLAAATGTNVPTLFERHTQSIFGAIMASDPPSWTKHSHQRKLVAVLLARAGKVLDSQAEPIVMIMEGACKPDNEHELRASLFASLGKALMNDQQGLNANGSLVPLSPRLVRNVILPNAVWRAGEKAAAIRLAALSCLWALLDRAILDLQHVPELYEALKPQLVTSLEDHLVDTRRIACQIVNALLTRAPDFFSGSSDGFDRLHALYPELLKRLDDNDDTVRVLACKAWLAYAKCTQQSGYDTQLYAAHVEAVVKGLLIHLDDADLTIQDAVRDAMVEMTSVAPVAIKPILEDAEQRHRHKQPCRVVIEACDKHLA